MIGHEPLWAMRKRGLSPNIVFINDFPCQTALDWHNPGAKYGAEFPIDHPTISTAGDKLEALDMRFLVGLNVSITSESEARAKELFDVAKKAGAIFVVSCHVIGNGTRFTETGWSEVYCG